MNLSGALAHRRPPPPAHDSDFNRRAMRLLHVIAVPICLLVLGCSHPSTTGSLLSRTLPADHQSARESSVLLLDNRGGYSHVGRRIALHEDGSYADTTYTDAIEGEHTKNGHYTLNPERTHLILSPQSGAAQDLFRVNHGGQQYWVREADRERITQPSESRLRQTSVRVVP